jgi:hypothetical protein
MFNGLVIAALLIGVAPAIACSPKLKLGVTVDHPLPIIRSTYNLNEIRNLAANSTQPLSHEAFGAYITTFGYQITAEYKIVADADCGTADAEVHLFLTNRIIEIASDLENYGCRRDSITAHYMLQAQNDDRIITIYADRIAEALRVRFDTHSSGDPHRDDVRYVARTAIKAVVDSAFQSFTDARETAAADNGQEVARLASACTQLF